MWKLPLCACCRYLSDHESTCLAYPDEIPNDFIRGRKFHTEICGDETEAVCFVPADDENIENIKRIFEIEV